MPHPVRRLSPLALLISLVVVAGGAGDPQGPGPIPIDLKDPVVTAEFDESPTTADIKAAWTAAGAVGIGGRVVLECRVAGERLAACAIFPASPAQNRQDAAALNLVPLFKVRPILADGLHGVRLFGQDNPLHYGEPAEGRRVRVSIDFSYAGDPAGPRLANPNLTDSADLDWIALPSSKVTTQLAPQRASREGQSGRAILLCRFSDRGYLTDCSVDESRPLFGFGEAALKLARFIRVRPVGSSWQPLVGKAVALPITFAQPG